MHGIFERRVFAVATKQIREKSHIAKVQRENLQLSDFDD